MNQKLTYGILKVTGKVNLYQMAKWSIMSDRSNYTIHPQPPGVTGSGCMDFVNERLDC